MTPLNEDGGAMLRVSERRRHEGKYVRADKLARRLVRPLLAEGFSPAQIAEAASLPLVTVNRAIRKIRQQDDARIIHRIRAMPDAERGRVHRSLQEVIGKALKEKPALDRNGHPVLDKEGNPVKVEPGSAELRTVIQALADQVKLVVGFAPVRSSTENLNVEAHLIDPERLRKVLASPEAREALLTLERLAQQSESADIMIGGGP